MNDGQQIITASREAGLVKAASFIDAGARHYGKLRNFDYGPERRHNVSMLSPYLRHRLVLEQEIIAAIAQTVGRHGAEKFIDEVFWRAYFKGWLEHRPSVWQHYCTDRDALIERLEADSELLERYTTACEGNTGIDAFDAWARELVDTGYLHNHARMWFASIWVFTLELPWQLGADFFLRHLIDGDPASNTLSWRWVSGLHTRGKTYLARVSNIANFTENRFSPNGRLATHAEPLTEDVEHAERPLHLLDEELPTRPYALLLTEEDGHPESWNDDLAPTAVVGALGVRRRSPIPVGHHAHGFARDAVAETTRRAETRFQCAASRFEADDWANALVAACDDANVKTLVTTYLPQGPVRDLVTSASSTLKANGIDVVLLSRQYDRAAWPYANRGYFKLKKRISRVIEDLQLDTAELPDELAAITLRQPDLLQSSG